MAMPCSGVVGIMHVTINLMCGSELWKIDAAVECWDYETKATAVPGDRKWPTKARAEVGNRGNIFGNAGNSN